MNTSRLASLLVLAASATAFGFEINLTTPEKASDELAYAIRSGTPKRIHDVIIAPKFRDAEIEALSKVGAATSDLESEVEKRWGEKARDAFGLWILQPLPPGMRWVITGDTAIVKDEKFPNLPVMYRAKRVNKLWKMDWTTGATEANSKRLVQQHEAMATRLESFITEIKAGKYKKMEDAVKKYKAVRSAPASQPSAAK